MAERRSIGEAMLTPEKLAFIQGRGETPPTNVPKEVGRTEETKLIEVEPRSEREMPKKEPSSRPQRRNRRSSQDISTQGDVLNQMLVPVTIRLSHRVAQALRRAQLEQRLSYAKPDTQQEIVEEAVSGWLIKHEYLD